MKRGVSSLSITEKLPLHRHLQDKKALIAVCLIFRLIVALFAHLDTAATLLRLGMIASKLGINIH
jgi:hypothetical protein